MLYREIIAVFSEIYTKHINTLCGHNVELLNVKLVVRIVTTRLQIGNKSSSPQAWRHKSRTQQLAWTMKDCNIPDVDWLCHFRCDVTSQPVTDKTPVCKVRRSANGGAKFALQGNQTVESKLQVLFAVRRAGLRTLNTGLRSDVGREWVKRW